MNSSLIIETNNTDLSNNEFIFTFALEENFDYIIYREWLKRHWFVSPVAIVVYVMAVHLGQAIMKNRPAFGLRGPLIFWNLLLALFSIAATVRIAPWLFKSLASRSFQENCCKEVKYPGPVAFWLAAFTISKLFEFIDTFFIIARKRKLIFLHWYHHATVLAFSWYANTEAFSLAPFLGSINFGIHSLMYSYYCATAMNLAIVSFVPMMITILQLSQMVIGMLLALYAYKSKIQDGCDASIKTIFFCALIYSSYFVLFGHFFFKRYLMRIKKTDSPQNGGGLKLE